MPLLLLTWVVTLKTAAQTMFGRAPDKHHSHSAVLNIHHPGGGRLHSYHRRGPFGNGVLYVHRQGKPAPTPLIIHRISSPYSQYNKLSHQKPRAAEDLKKAANISADVSVPIDVSGSGRTIDLSSILLAPTDYFNAEEINGISGKVPVETVVYPLAKTIQKHYIPRQQPFYVRLPPEHPLRHIPVAMVVTPPVVPQYFRSSNWYLPKDGVPPEERTPSLPTPKPSSLPPQPSSPPPAAPLPPLFFPAHNYYTFVPAENETNEHQPAVPALHPPHHFPYNNCYASVPENDERSFSFQNEYYDPSKLQMQQNNARSEEHVDSSSRSFEQPPSYYFPKTGYQAYDPSKLQALAKGEARTLPHHHASYHETTSHNPFLIHEGHGEGIHKHILIEHSEPAPYVHSDLAPTLYDDLHLTHGGHSTYLHEEPVLHGHLSLNLGRNAPSYDVPNMRHIYDDGFHQPMFSSVSDPWPVSSSIPYEYGNPSHIGYSSSPHIVKHNIPIYSRNTPNEEQQNKQQDLPYLLRRLRSFKELEHQSASDLGNLASESDQSLTISLPVDISNTADTEKATNLQKKEAISEDNNPDFHPKTAQLLDLPQVLNLNEVKKRFILETILSRKASSEEDKSHKAEPPVNSDTRSFSKNFSESSALHQVEMEAEVHPKQLPQEIPMGSVTEKRDISLQSAHHEQDKSISSLDTLWRKMRAKRSKRETFQMQNNNTSPDSDSKTTASSRSQEEERTIGYVIGFLDPESYNHYYGSENTQKFASDQNYHISDFKPVYDKTKHVLIPVYYRERKTDSYIPVNSMSYKKTATSDPRSVQEDVANPNITKNDGYWTYNKTARYNSFGGDSFPAYYEPYPIQHNSHNPELVPVSYHQFVEHVMPHRFLNTYPEKLYQPKAYPMYPYDNNKMHDSSTRYHQTNGYFADISDYHEEPQMNARSFNMGPANEHPIRHHHYPNTYNTHPNRYNKQGNVRPHDGNAHQPRPGRYYAYISQEPELDARPYHSFNGANVHPIQHHRPSRYYAHLSGYPHEKPTDGRSVHNSDYTEEGPVRQHYTRRYYEHASKYPPRDTRFYDYNDEGYYHPSRYFNPALATTPYGDTELIEPYPLDRYEYTYQPNRDITSYQVDNVHQHPNRYHHLHRYHERIHGHSYQPTYHMERFHPSRYHHSRRYQEHVHSREATSNSKIPETNEHPQIRSVEEETDEYPQTIQSGINLEAITELPLGSNYPSKYYASVNPESHMVSFLTTDKRSPYPIRFHRLDPYGPAYHPSQYMNPNWEGGYNTAGYFTKMEA